MAQDIGLAFMLSGAVFMFLAAVGVARMPDLFTRMHANTKSVTLRVGCLMLGVSLYFSDLSLTARASAVIVFIFTTVPVGAHMLGRAAYFAGVPLWEGTLSDELRGHYDFATHTLASLDSPEGGAIDSLNTQDN